MPTIEEVVGKVIDSSQDGWDRDSLVAALTGPLQDREEEVRDHLLIQATQHGTDPRLVAKVLMDTGLGKPRSSEEMTYINNQYLEAIAYWQEVMRQRGTEDGS